MNFIKFSTSSMKAKMGWIQEKLNLPVTHQRDRATIKALKNFQKENGITPNAVVCETTFECLNQL